MCDMPQYYRRNLPHLQPPGACLFITFRLADSLPRADLESLRQERLRLSRDKPRPGESPRDRILREAKKIFGRMDEMLGKESANPSAATPKWLADSRIAELVRDALYFRDGERYHLLRYVIMPNHVHLVIQPLPITGPTPGVSHGEDVPQWPLRRILQSLKGYTAREANRILGRRGRFGRTRVSTIVFAMTKSIPG